MQTNWRKKFFPNPLQAFLVVVGFLWACAAVLAGVQGFPASPFVFMALICLGAAWVVAHQVRKPSVQDRIQ